MKAFALVITRSGSKTAQQGSVDMFTGTVRVTALFDANEGMHASCASVSFEAGGRSALHTHPRGQLLIFTAGGRGGAERGGPRRGDPAGGGNWDSPRREQLACGAPAPR